MELKLILSRTKIIKALLIVLLATGAIISSETWSAWSDKESSEENILTSGILDLQIGGTDLSGVAKITVANGYPGMAEAVAIDSYINNAGTVAMNSGVTLAVVAIQDDENGLLEPEVDVLDDASTGELCGQLEIKVQADMDDSGVLGDSVGDIVYDWGVLSVLGNKYLGNLDAITGTNSSRLFKIEYRIPTTAGNDIMSDSCSFDMDFRVNQ